jgi:isoamylase
MTGLVAGGRPTVGRGRSYPVGPSVAADGVNFSVWSRTATSMELLLFDGVEDPEPVSCLPLDPAGHRTYGYWHVEVPGVRAGQVYAWRVHGPHDPARGLRHDPEAVLLDPYGRSVAVPTGYLRSTGGPPDPRTAMRSVVADLSTYDWEGDRPLERPFARTVVYELHVRGFTAHPSSGVARELAGTYAGLVEKIPYLESLGVTAVELMPVLAFDRQDAPAGLVNHWGYSPVSFFAPHPGYASTTDPLGVIDEFRDMVKALHRAGIEVILDVVFNHTAEGGAGGPTFCWRGLDNDDYYILDPEAPEHYADYTGCGNTLDANHAVVRRMIVDALHHWVAGMHVDGFRFDLASILSRDSQGRPMADPPVIWQIQTDPVLAGTKLIAEAWDAAGLYQVGSFAGDRWREWNGRFRDDVRRFVRGDAGLVRTLPDRLLASPDLYAGRPSEVEHSVNFVTCHDGMTLNDLVSYDRKHNEANLEGGRDGTDADWSWNCGVEGATDDPAVAALRNRQVKNLLAITLIAMGVPMLSMGDEVRRTQRGNNNAWCHDDETSWLDWSLADEHADVLRFVRGLVRLRLAFDMTTVAHGLTLREFLARSRVEFHGVELHRPDWSDDSHTLALTVRSVVGTRNVHAVLNAWREPLDFALPPVDPALPWRRVVDTALDPPDDITDLASAPAVTGATYRAEAHSVVLLAADRRVVLRPDEVDGVVFDMDGVVTRTAEVHRRAWKRMFDDWLAERSAATGEVFREFTDEDYRVHVDGKRREDGVAAFLASRGIEVDAETVRAMSTRKNDAFLRTVAEDGVEAYPSTVQLVHDLHAAGIGVAIITASRNATAILSAARVADLFPVRVDGEVAAELGLPGKPDPAVFLEAARRLGVPAGRAVVVEDAIAGVEAGRRGGFRLVIGVDRTGHPDALRAAGAHVVVSDLEEVTVARAGSPA